MVQTVSHWDKDLLDIPICPQCGLNGVKRAKDIEGTTYCENNHEWKQYPLKQNLASEQNTVHTPQIEGENLKLTKHIQSVIRESAAAAREDAGYAGRWDDGGASAKLEHLKYWLDGIEYAKTGKTTVYKTISSDFARATDPDYEIWLRLKEKFEG